MHAHRTTTRLAAIGFALVLVLAACGSSSGSDSSSKTTTTEAASSGGGGAGKTIKISIEGFKFTPNDLKAKVGDKIEVTNDDGAPHTFTSADKSVQKFDSGKLAKGKSYTITLTKKGTINYGCTIHDYMKGSIEVS